jgi:hypothetical protein
MAMHAQGMIPYESTFAGAGRQSRAELVVLAHGAQAFPLMHQGPGKVVHVA